MSSSQELGFAVLGGTLISIATSFNLFFKGRITGMSGIYFGLITHDPKTFHWKALFVMTSIMTSIVVWEITKFDPVGTDYPNFFDPPAILVRNLSQGGYFLAGLLVGIGTKLGNGCTSGHGVCGIPRFSIRSWVYVPIFVICAIITATFRYYVPFLDEDDASDLLTKNYDSVMEGSVLITGWGLLLYFFYFFSKLTKEDFIEICVTMITAIVFALGLIISGMNKRSKILGFLIMGEDWDASLLLVLVAAVGLNLFTFYYIIKIHKKTVFNEKLEIPSNNKIDKKLILGGISFGLGWGLGGLCPGPGYVLFPFLTPHISFFWFFGLTVGQYFVKIVDEKMSKKTNSIKSK